MREGVAEAIDLKLGRIVDNMEKDTRWRQWVHEKFDEIKGKLFGNGQKGLIREMDQVQSEVHHLRNDFVDFRQEVKDMVRSVAGWAIASCVGALALIAFEIVMMILRKGP